MKTRILENKINYHVYFHTIAVANSLRPDRVKDTDRAVVPGSVTVLIDHFKI